MGTNPASEKCEVREWWECGVCGQSVESAPAPDGCLLCSTPSTSGAPPPQPPRPRHRPPPSATTTHLTQVSVGARRQLFKEEEEEEEGGGPGGGGTGAGPVTASSASASAPSDRPFACHHCQKAFSSKFKLVRHVLIHSETRQFVCNVCHRTFHRKDHLKNHAKVHSPVKRVYKCSEGDCCKEYSSVLSYKKHCAVHSAHRGHLECLLCGLACPSKEELLLHLRVHSGSRPARTQADKKYKCLHCDRRFFTGKDVRRHLVVHTGKRDFACSACPQRFGRKDHLVRHMKKSHGGGAGRKRKRTTRSVGSIVEEVMGESELPLLADLPEDLLTQEDSLLIECIMKEDPLAEELPLGASPQDSPDPSSPHPPLHSLPTFDEAFPP